MSEKLTDVRCETCGKYLDWIAVAFGHGAPTCGKCVLERSLADGTVTRCDCGRIRFDETHECR